MAAKNKLGAKVGKHKLGTRAGKYKLGARIESRGPSKGSGAGKHKCPLYFNSKHIDLFLLKPVTSFEMFCTNHCLPDFDLQPYCSEAVDRSCSVEKVFLEILQSSQESTCRQGKYCNYLALRVIKDFLFSF